MCVWQLLMLFWYKKVQPANTRGLQRLVIQIIPMSELISGMRKQLLLCRTASLQQGSRYTADMQHMQMP